MARVSKNLPGIVEVPPEGKELVGYGGRTAVNAAEYMRQVHQKLEEEDSFEALYNEAQAVQKDAGSVPRETEEAVAPQQEVPVEEVKAKPKRRGAKRTVGKAVSVLQYDKEEEAAVQTPTKPAVVRTRVTLPGFGVVPTEFRCLDIGPACVHIALTDYSWCPPQAAQDEDGTISGGFQFEELPGKTLYHLGLEWTDSEGVRHLVLCFK